MISVFMTEEEVRACIFHDIFHCTTLHPQLVSENKEMKCTVTPGSVVGEGKAWVWMVIDKNDSFNNRHKLIMTSKGVYDYIRKYGNMGISFKDLLEYKTLMDM